MAADVSQLVLDYVQKSGVRTDIPLSAAMSIVRSKIALAEQINEDLAANFKKWGMGAFTPCPNCKSETMLEFVACHWCGFMLLDSTRPTNELDLVPATETATKKKPVTVRMGKEPPATLNFGGAPSKEEVKAPKEEKEEKPRAETPVEDKIALLKGLIETAESKETSGSELNKINVMANLGVDAKKCGKTSVFRAAIVEGLNAAVEALKIEEPVVEKKAAKAKKGKAKKEDDGDEVLDDPTPFKSEKEAKGKKKAKIVEIDESELEEEKPVKGKGKKVVAAPVIDDEDLFEDDGEEGDEDVDGEEDTTVAVSDDDDFDDIDLDTITADALKDEDFDLDEE